MKLFSSVVIKRLLVVFLALQASVVNAASHRSMSGWLVLDYPDGWEALLTDESNTRYVENVGLQPRGQDFAGRDGQFALRVFDPLYVYDEAGLLSTDEPEQIFRSFVRSLPGETSAQFVTDTSGGATVYVARNQIDNMQTVYFGKQAPNGFVIVAGGASSKNSADQLEKLVRDTFRSTRFEAPPGTNMEPAKIVEEWYSALSEGNSSAMTALTCAKANGLQNLITLITDSNISNALNNATRAFDLSGLRFFLLEANDTAAAVRISGPVRRPDGSVVSFYSGARTFGSNVLVVRKETGGWKICEPLTVRK